MYLAYNSKSHFLIEGTRWQAYLLFHTVLPLTNE